MKKLIIISAAFFLPFLASAAVLNNAFTVGSMYPAPGTTTSVSSSCGSTASNSTVSFTLTQNGFSTQISSTLFTDSNGNFSGNITLPSSYNAGSAVLVANCNKTGDTVNSPTLTFSAPATTTFGLSSTSPSVGGIYNVTGACGNSNGTGSVLVTLSSNGTNYPLGTFDLSSTGTFANTVIIPNNASVGNAVLKATCSNNTTFSSTIVLDQTAVNSFTLSTNPIPGNTVMISGNCTNVLTNQNGAVSFNVYRNGSVVNLPANNNLTNNTSYFNSSVLFPSNVGSDPANLVVTCPNGSTYSNLIILGAATAVTIPVVITPVGGVAAGTQPQSMPSNVIFGEILLVVGLTGLLGLGSKKLYAKISSTK